MWQNNQGASFLRSVGFVLCVWVVVVVFVFVADVVVVCVGSW